MAKKITQTTELIDDVDGGKASRTIPFTFDGVSYEIDLSTKNANAMTRAVRPYVDRARVVKASRAGRGSARRTTKRAGATRQDTAAIRVWAADNGFEISARGRVPSEVLAAYDAR